MEVGALAGLQPRTNILVHRFPVSQHCSVAAVVAALAKRVMGSESRQLRNTNTSYSPRALRGGIRRSHRGPCCKPKLASLSRAEWVHVTLRLVSVLGPGSLTRGSAHSPLVSQILGPRLDPARGPVRHVMAGVAVFNAEPEHSEAPGEASFALFPQPWLTNLTP
ncbi:hypothetical protein VTK26DRAFT_1961 [Humicola hyalothermophila]